MYFCFVLRQFFFLVVWLAPISRFPYLCRTFENSLKSVLPLSYVQIMHLYRYSILDREIRLVFFRHSSIGILVNSKAHFVIVLFVMGIGLFGKTIFFFTTATIDQLDPVSSRPQPELDGCSWLGSSAVALSVKRSGISSSSSSPSTTSSSGSLSGFLSGSFLLAILFDFDPDAVG